MNHNTQIDNYARGRPGARCESPRSRNNMLGKIWIRIDQGIIGFT